MHEVQIMQKPVSHFRAHFDTFLVSNVSHDSCGKGQNSVAKSKYVTNSNLREQKTTAVCWSETTCVVLTMLIRCCPSGSPVCWIHKWNFHSD